MHCLVNLIWVCHYTQRIMASGESEGALWPELQNTESPCNGLGVAGGQPQLFLPHPTPKRSSEWPLLVMGQVERAAHNRLQRDASGLEKLAASVHKFQGAESAHEEHLLKWPTCGTGL